MANQILGLFLLVVAALALYALLNSHCLVGILVALHVIAIALSTTTAPNPRTA